ncbi:MAG: ECF transporter S component [Eubacterium sp.]|nr:ECF transporter S component [Eubacterium sp.]
MNEKTKKIVGVGIFTAIVVVLQLLGSFIKFGTFSVSLVLIPIIVGAALYDFGAGAWLGFVFGVTVLLSGDATPFLAVNPVGTVVTVLLKGTLAGLAAGAVFKALEKKSGFAATICAGITAPVVNTGVFLLGCLVFFMPTIQEWATAAGVESAGKFMIVGLVGLNFVFELVINLVLSSVIVKLISLGKKEVGSAKTTKTVTIEVDGDINKIDVD